MKALLHILIAFGMLAAPAGAQEPQAEVDELLAADRAFAQASAKTDLVSGLSAMFAEDVIMPAPQVNFARGKAAAVAALSATPANAVSKAHWTPVRGGLSADGTHGFTYGYMTISEAGKPDRRGKYLSYWVKGPDGWRVAAYKRAPRPEGEASETVLPPALPRQLTAAFVDDATVERHRASLVAAEKAFSDEAQEIGLGPAFFRNGSPDAMNMGRGPAFTIGAEAIGREVGGGASGPSPVSWDAGEGALVAPSGDLGVTFGVIRPNVPPAEGQPTAFPFFTIWRRDAPDGRWLYIAE
jgi:ketosteroid isomerase-like protein